MKHTRLLMILIPSTVLVASIVGFFVTYDAAPQAAFARIFIDLGVAVALMIATVSIPKPPKLRTDEIVDALRDLVRGRYDRRLNDREFEELNEVARAFNEVAGWLSDTRDLNLNHVRYRAGEPKRPVLNENHSYHPELGQVTTVKDDFATPILSESSVGEIAAPQMSAEDAQDLQKAELAFSDVPAPRNDSFEESDLNLLYERFSDAHRQVNQVVVDFKMFKSTIDRAREDLLTTHQCREVKFDVVMESGEVALRPRLVR